MANFVVLGHNSSMPSSRVNVADRLERFAVESPEGVAVACPHATCSFAELDADADALARGLIDLGVQPGTRLALLVPPGVEFVKLVFALLRSGATSVLVDPGMGRKHLANCLVAAEPDGFVAVSRAQAVRAVLRRRFPRAAINVTVGRRWFWGGVTYEQLLSGVARPKVRRRAWSDALPPTTPIADSGRATQGLPITQADDPAAIIFTSGSTGPPKGVLYTHRMFETQVAEIQRAYDLQPGGVDLACFALFALFNSALGVTTVFPEMDFSRPASANPRKLLAAANQWRVTQAFASPAVWDKLSRHCERTGDRIPALRKVFSCGAPVPADVLRRTLACVRAGAEMHTPYGATEALPVSTIEAKEVLGVARPESSMGVDAADCRVATPFGGPQGVPPAAATARGAGVCVGRKFDSIEWRVIRITDDPIADINAAEELPRGEIGELIVRGPQVSRLYVSLPAPSPRRGGSKASTGDPKSPERSRGSSCEATGRGAEAGTRRPPPSLSLPAEGRGPEDPNLANRLAKIPDPVSPWHRMGDVGYLDDAGRFWYCGRKSHRVETAAGTLYTECVEAILNAHPSVRRSALVGAGPRDAQAPIVIVEPSTSFVEDHALDFEIMPYIDLANELLALAAANPVSAPVKQVLFYPLLPVDVRHNAKINREALAELTPMLMRRQPAVSSLQPPASRLTPTQTRQRDAAG